jgi:hypothetical protein
LRMHDLTASKSSVPETERNFYELNASIGRQRRRDPNEKSPNANRVK